MQRSDATSALLESRTGAMHSRGILHFHFTNSMFEIKKAAADVGRVFRH
jgi:hypothetical protein